MTIDWIKNPTIPAIAQDSETNEILMLAYMNEEAYNLTLSTGYAHYFSRSRQRIWKKGESSGHTQEIVDILLDCDADTLVLKIIQSGVACHTGRKSCFFTSVARDEIIAPISAAITNPSTPLFFGINSVIRSDIALSYL